MREGRRRKRRRRTWRRRERVGWGWWWGSVVRMGGGEKGPEPQPTGGHDRVLHTDNEGEREEIGKKERR